MGGHNYQDFRRSLDGISYDLSYLGESEKTRIAIIETIHRLPNDVREFALERCSFISVGDGTNGLVFPGRIGVHTHT